MKNVFLITLMNLTFFFLFDRAVGTWYHRKKVRERKENKQKVRVADPIYHHGLTPNANSMQIWGRDSFRLCTNSLGMRDNQPRQVSLTTDKRRVVWIGDSFTEGLGVDYTASFVGLFDLEARPTGVEHLNMGVMSYSPELFVRKLDYYLKKGLRIDTLVVCLDNSDMQDEIGYHSFYHKTPDIGYYMDTSTAKDFQKETAATEGKFLHRLVSLYNRTHSLTYMLLDEFQRKMRGDTGNADLSPWDRRYYYEREHVAIDTAVFERWGRLGLSYMSKNMDRILQMAREKGFFIRVVIYPWPQHLTAKAFDNVYTRFWNDYCSRNGIPILNLFKGFQKLTDSIGVQRTIDSLYIRGDSHFTEAGNRFMFEEMRRSW